MSSAVEAALRDLSADRLMAHVERFARRARHAGTADEYASFEELRAEMDSLGFATELIRHDAYISLPGAASLAWEEDRPRCITHSFSVATPPEGVRGHVVDVGEGSAAQFADRDLRGRILLVDGIAGPEVADRARIAGASGLIHVSPHAHLHEMCISPVWGNPSPETIGLLPTSAVVTIAKADGERLAAALRERPVEALIRTEVDTGWRLIPLLVADMAPLGAGPDTPFVLLAGHHDSWHAGAMDNGSANAVMIEVARIASADRSHWTRGLRVCFWSGHSQGRYAGSAWYADTHWHELDRRCAVHINIDSLGGRGASRLVDAASSLDLSDFAAHVILAETGQVTVGRRLSRSADMSFLGIGLSSMFGTLSHQPPVPIRMRAPLGWWWHTPDDTPDKLDPAALLRDGRITLRAVLACLVDPVLPLKPSMQIRSLIDELEALEPKIGKRLALDVVIEQAKMMGRKLEALEDAILAKAIVDDADLLLMKVSRCFVPLDSVGCDRFDHDPALPLGPRPILSSLHRLAQADSAHVSLWTTAARRSLNRIHHALCGANDLF